MKLWNFATLQLCNSGTLQLFIFATFLCGSVLLADDVDFQVLKGKHFIIQYEGESGFARKVLHQAEKHYKRIIHDLGYTKHDGFWLWDDRVVIRLYGSRERFAKGVNAPDWAVGKADYEKRTIAGVAGSEQFLKSVLPHEMGHLVFRDFIGFGNNAPLWLDEGVAQWQDLSTRDTAHKAAISLSKQKKLMSLAYLTSLDLKAVVEGDLAVVFYVQSCSVVGFMIEKYGTERFTDFCRKLRDGNSLGDSLRFTYPDGARNIKELELSWSKRLETKS